MFYKIRNDVLFRRYDHHGYITDNSEYGYRFLDDTSSRPGETFVSESGAVMLSTLSKSPRDIESIVDDLMRIFRGVGRDDLKLDVVEFFHSLVEKGYLSEGGTASTCVDPDLPLPLRCILGRGLLSFLLKIAREARWGPTTSSGVFISMSRAYATNAASIATFRTNVRKRRFRRAFS